MSSAIYIGNRRVGEDSPPYVIAELSANHNGDINRAIEIVEMAAKAGADAIKLQTYRADTITIDSDKDEFRIHGGLWDGKTLYELYDWAHLPWEWHKPLFEKARELGITIFSSPFDETAVEFLESLDVPAYKVASFEIVDLPLIRCIAETGKPMIMSTGMANIDEIEEAVTAAREAGCRDLVLLHCVSGYPTPVSDCHLRTITDMSGRFGAVTGLSDHTLTNTSAIAAVALGACVVEKHVTLDRKGGGPDDSFSLEPDELKNLCRDVRQAWEALGTVNYERKESERGNALYRRSLYVVDDVAKGDLLTRDNVRSIRPGYGIMPKFLDQVLGHRASENIEKGTALQWRHVAD